MSVGSAGIGFQQSRVNAFWHVGADVTCLRLSFGQCVSSVLFWLRGPGGAVVGVGCRVLALGFAVRAPDCLDMGTRLFPIILGRARALRGDVFPEPEHMARCGGVRVPP